MERSDWQRIQDIFHAALKRPPADRAAFVEAACAESPELLHQLRGLLARADQTDPLLDRPLTDIASSILDDGRSFPDAIGPYRVVRLLGEGGMGVVFLAERADLGSRAAVKMLRDAWLSPARRERFHSEQRTLARLNHPAIARLYDADTLPDGTPYIVMEYVEGESVTGHCSRTNAPLAERLRLFRQVCEAVQHAHAHAIIHRDLKPSNVLVSTDGSVKLLDFGIARQLDAVDMPGDPTRTGLRLMTPSYAAPEQLLGEAPGVWTDIYALGVLLYEMVTGRQPHDLAGLTPAQVERRVLEDSVTPIPEALRAGRRGSAAVTPVDARGERALLGELDVIAARAMHPEPHRRYATVDALIRDLDHLQRGEPLDARPDSVGYRAGKFIRRNRQPVSAAALLLVMLVGLTGFHTARLARERVVAEGEAAKARTVSDYLIGLFEASDPFEADDSLDVRALLARGEARVETLAGQPVVQAEMLAVLGRVYTALSDFDRAEPLLLRALDLHRSHGDDHVALATVLGALGRLHRYGGDYDTGVRYAREALDIIQRHRPGNHQDLADAMDNLGVIVAQQGNYQEAEALYRRALELRRRLYPEPDARLAHSLNNLGVNLANQGDYAGAVGYLRESLQVGAAALGADHASLATDLANLGVVLEILGDYAAADSMLTEAVRIKRLRLGDDHYETAFTLGQLGYVLMQAGQLERAESAFREALDISRRVLDPSHRDAGIVRVNLSRVLQLRDRLDEAEPILREGIDILTAALGEDSEFVAISRCRLGDLLYQQRQVVRAESLFRRCLGVLESALPADHDILAVLRSTFGGMLRAEGRFVEAEPLLVAAHDALLAQFGPDHHQTREAAERLRLLHAAVGAPR